MNATFPRFLGALAVFGVVLTESAEASAPAGRYIVAGGTVTDTKTKLVWQQTAPAEDTWANAKAFCQTVGASLGGTGWRLPTIKELQTIVDDSVPRAQATAMIDPTAFPATPVAAFWSSSPLAGSPTIVWIVDFHYGSTAHYPMTLMYVRFRCVR
jgi:hypothetical protein